MNKDQLIEVIKHWYDFDFGNGSSDRSELETLADALLERFCMRKAGHAWIVSTDTRHSHDGIYPHEDEVVICSNCGRTREEDK